MARERWELLLVFGLMDGLSLEMLLDQAVAVDAQSGGAVGQ